MKKVYMEEIDPLVDYLVERFQLDRESAFSRDFFEGIIQGEFSHDVDGLRQFFHIHPKALLSIIKADIEMKLYSAKLFVGVSHILLSEAEERREKWKFEYLFAQVCSLEQKVRYPKTEPLALAA